MATLLIGYDVERQDVEATETRAFLDVAPKLHQELNAPCTFFLCGRTLENSVERFQKVKEEYGDLIDFQQHTYSHVLLKTVCQKNDEGFTVFKGGTLDEIREQVAKTNQLLKTCLDIECIGLTGPYGYYRGLSDRPDILEILHELGIRFTRTFARDANDWQPLAFEVQPFWYEPQGFPDVLEFPVQGWQDCIIRGRIGWANREGYLNHLKRDLDYIAEHDLVWAYAQHDWSSIQGDPDLWITRNLIVHAIERGIQIESYKTFYERKVAER